MRSDIFTLEDLMLKIASPSIKPTPQCRNLEYIFSWKSFVEPWLTDPPLANHSKYHSFHLTREDRNVKFRAKRLPQSAEMEPRSGIRLLKEGVQFDPVGAAEFRVDDIPFERIRRTVGLVVAKLPLLEKMNVQESWDKLQETLEAAPRKKDLYRKMCIIDLPRQSKDESTNLVPSSVDDNSEGNAITGDYYDETIEEGSYDDIMEDVDVCVYTKTLQGRPWVGRVKEMLPGGRFVIHWFGRRSGRGGVFKALTANDGSPQLTELELSTIMFWGFSENRCEDSFKLSPFWLETIRVEYERLDMIDF